MIDDSEKTIKITLVKSLIGTKNKHRSIVKGLGLKKINSTAKLKNTDSVQGMIKKVNYLIKCE
ncbi:MAG: 50S ribosomal protein L30 [Nitrosomonas sp.]|nr:50S ribosomal protein L30 [Nitrosomonas sp.]